MEEFDEPVTLELRTEREVAVLMFSLGLGAGALLDSGMEQGAQALSNLQIRTAKADGQRVSQALNEYGDGGILTSTAAGATEMSPDAAVSEMAEKEEVDPDEVTRGRL